MTDSDCMNEERGPVEVTNYIQKPVITISVFYGST